MTTKNFRITITYKTLRDLFNRLDALEGDEDAHRYKVEELKRDHANELKDFADRIKSAEDALRGVVQERDRLVAARDAADKMAFQKGYDHGVAVAMETAKLNQAFNGPAGELVEGRTRRALSAAFKEKRIRVGKVP